MCHSRCVCLNNYIRYDKYCIKKEDCERIEAARNENRRKQIIDEVLEDYGAMEVLYMNEEKDSSPKIRVVSVEEGKDKDFGDMSQALRGAEPPVTNAAPLNGTTNTSSVVTPENESPSQPVAASTTSVTLHSVSIEISSESSELKNDPPKEGV